MKATRVLVIGLAFTAAVAAQAQDIAGLTTVNRSEAAAETRRTLNFHRVEANYLLNLQSDIPGVVESALGHITLMRIAYPKQNLRLLHEKLYDLASQGATRSIRYKAFIAMQVFANPAAFKESIKGRLACGDGLLEEIAVQQFTER